MKKWTAYLIFIFLVLLLTECSRKQDYTCGIGALMNKPTIQSKILSLKTVGISDTITAFVSGKILGKDSMDKKVTIDTLIYSAITFINHEINDTIGTFTDINGKYQKHLQAGTYDIIIKYVGYVWLTIKNVSFGQGELKEIDVLLGQQGEIIDESVIDAKHLNCSTYFDKKLNKQVHTFTDKMPEYGKGTADILTFFSRNFVNPKEQQYNFQGSIIISFVVDTDGQLKNIEVDKKFSKDPYSPVDLEAIRVFKLMPAWSPGKCNGLTVPVKMKLPIKF